MARISAPLTRPSPTARRGIRRARPTDRTRSPPSRETPPAIRRRRRRSACRCRTLRRPDSWPRMGSTRPPARPRADATGNGRTGTVSGAAWNAAGRFGGALSFDGVNDLVTVADANALDLDERDDPLGLGTADHAQRLAHRNPQGSAERAVVRALRARRSSAAGGLRPAGKRRPDRAGVAALALNTWSHLDRHVRRATLRLS